MSGLVKTGLIIAIGLLLGRLAGFLREAMLASTFGAGANADVAILLLTIPDLLASVLVGGALSAALIPEFKRLDPPRAAALFIQSSGLILVALAAFAMVASLFSEALVFVFAPGLGDTQLSRVAEMVDYTLWLIPLTTVAGASVAYLHANNRFGVASLNTLIFNLVTIAGLALIAGGHGGLDLLCVFVLLGGLLRWLSQLLVLPRPLFLTTSFRSRLINRELVVRYLQVTSTGGLLLLLPVIARALASFGGEGAIASFNYSIRLAEFALGVTITVLSVAIFPRLAECFARNDEARFKQLFVDGLWWILVLSFVTAASLFWFCGDMVRLVYGWGRMTDPTLEGITVLTLTGLVSLPFQGVSSFLTAIFNARRDTRSPLIANLCAVILFVPLGMVMHGAMGLAGIMWALVMSYILVLVLQILQLKIRHQLTVGDVMLEQGTLKAVMLVLLVCSVVAGIFPDTLKSPLLGLLGAGLSAALALITAVGTHPRYRNLALTRLRLR